PLGRLGLRGLGLLALRLRGLGLRRLRLGALAARDPGHHQQPDEKPARTTHLDPPVPASTPPATAPFVAGRPIVARFGVAGGARGAPSSKQANGRAVERDLLVISDLHLGESLGATSDRTRDLDRALVEFLAHHARSGRWRLVVNGDMLDLVGATVLPAEVGWV